MRHPFELEISELESINLKIQKITDEEAEKLAGGLLVFTTAAVGEEGGNPGVTKAAFLESGGRTTYAMGEEGGNPGVTRAAFESGSFPIGIEPR